LWVHWRAWSDSLHSFRDDGFTSFQSFFDNPHSTDPFAHLDCSDVDLVFSVYDADLIASLQFVNRSLGNQQRALPQTRNCPDSTILPGPQRVAAVREDPGQSNCAGLLIDFAVGNEELSLLRIGSAVGQHQFQFEFSSCGIPLTLR